MCRCRYDGVGRGWYVGVGMAVGAGLVCRCRRAASIAVGRKYDDGWPGVAAAPGGYATTDKMTTGGYRQPTGPNS